MAARENQGYLIAVIILVLLTLVLALSAFLGISKAAEHSDTLKTEAKKLLFAQKLGDANAIKSEIYVALIGDQGPSVAEVETQINSLQRIATNQELATDEQQQIDAITNKVKEVIAQYNDDMLGSGAETDGEPAQTPTYRKKLQDLTALVADRNKDLNIQVNFTKDAEQKAKDDIARKDNDLKISKEAKDKALADLKSEHERSLANQQKLKNDIKQANGQLDAANTKFQTLQTTSTDTINGLKVAMEKSESQNEELKTRINRLTREVYDRPDGSIVKVASGLHSVFIDLGREDGLTNNRTFSIYDQSVTNFDANNYKAKIEVTNVSDYGALARITEEDPTNPILAGDYVLTATWDPGVPVLFALAGYFDLDNDGYDDTAKLSRMIKRNGGEVAVQHDAEGNIEGTMSPNIRFLVKGDPPKLGTEGYTSIVDSMRSLEDQAEQYTVQVIDLLP